MSNLITEMIKSLGGYLAELLHPSYAGGEVETLADPGAPFHTSQESVSPLRDALAEIGALIAGRRNFEFAGRWGGSHPMGVPLDEIAVSPIPTRYSARQRSLQPGSAPDVARWRSHTRDPRAAGVRRVGRSWLLEDGTWFHGSPGR